MLSNLALWLSNLFAKASMLLVLIGGTRGVSEFSDHDAMQDEDSWGVGGRR